MGTDESLRVHGRAQARPNEPTHKPPRASARCFPNLWLLKALDNRVHISEPGAARAECGMLVNDDWRKLPKSTLLEAITCPVCLRVLVEMCREN